MTEKYILTGNVQNGRQYQITDTEEDYAYRNNKKDKQKLCNLLNNLVKENKELKLQNEELLYQIGEVGKNNKTCRECECFIPENEYCYMWDMKVEADDVVVACDQRKAKKHE